MANQLSESPRSPRAVAHCIFRRAGKVLLIRIEDPDTGARGWRAPGGGIEWLETAEDACRREIREELGVELATIRQVGVVEGFINWRGKDEHEIVFVFEATPMDWSRLEAENVLGIEASGRVLNLQWLDPTELAASGDPIYPAGVISHLLAFGAPRIRAVALCALERNGEYLVSEAWDAVKRRHFRRFPGGGIEHGELAEEAVRREMGEELDTELEDVRLLGILENVFEYQGQLGHEVEFVFAATATNRALYEMDEGFLTEAGGPEPIRWIARDSLNDGADLVPEGAFELLMQQDRSRP